MVDSPVGYNEGIVDGMECTWDGVAEGSKCVGEDEGLLDSETLDTAVPLVFSISRGPRTN